MPFPMRLKANESPQAREQLSLIPKDAGASVPRHTADADLNPAVPTRRVFLLALTGAASRAAFQADVSQTSAEPDAQIWLPTAVRAFFEDPEGYCS